MTYQQIFKDVKKYFAKANTSHFTQEFAFQFNITGEGEGIFYAAYKNGVLDVEPYDYLDRDVIFEADGTTLKEIASGKLEVIDAVKAGKLAIDGDHEAAKQLLFLVSTKKTTTVKKAAPKAEEKAAEKKEEEKAAAKKETKTVSKKETKTAAKTAPKAAAKKPAAKTVEKTAKTAVKAAKTAAKGKK